MLISAPFILLKFLCIFPQTRKAADWLSKEMTKQGHAVALLSGDLDMQQRHDVIERFRDGKEKVLITTNVSSRGRLLQAFCSCGTVKGSTFCGMSWLYLVICLQCLHVKTCLPDINMEDNQKLCELPGYGMKIKCKYNDIDMNISYHTLLFSMKPSIFGLEFWMQHPTTQISTFYTTIYM